MFKVKIFPDRQDLFQSLAKSFLHHVKKTLETDNCSRVVLGGGRTPVELNSYIVKYSKETFIDWNRVNVYFSDERMVQREHTDNTASMISNTLAYPLGIPTANIHSIEPFYCPKLAADKYERKLISLKKNKDGTVFHLAILGIGPDGHTASLFPESSALEEHKRYAAVSGKGPEGWERVTMTYKAFQKTGKIWFIAAGQEKKEILDKLINRPLHTLTYPVQRVQPYKGNPVLWVDENAWPKN